MSFNSNSGPSFFFFFFSCCLGAIPACSVSTPSGGTEKFIFIQGIPDILEKSTLDKSIPGIFIPPPIIESNAFCIQSWHRHILPGITIILPALLSGRRQMQQIFSYSCPSFSSAPESFPSSVPVRSSFSSILLIPFLNLYFVRKYSGCIKTL